MPASAPNPSPAGTPTAAAAPARSRREADPLALALLTQLRPSSGVDRMLVWRALGSRVQGALSERGQQALDAARACFDDVREGEPSSASVKPLSEREYKGWYEEERDAGRRWPSVSSVRNWLGGSWPSVQTALGQSPSVSSTASRLAAQGGAFTDDELLTQLRVSRQALAAERHGAGAKPLGYVTQPKHREWARRELAKPADQRALPRLCLQPSPFQRFGSWAEAVIASGGGGPEALNALARAQSRKSRSDFSAEECVAAVVRVGTDGGGGAAMTWPAYKTRASKLRLAALRTDDSSEPPLPSPEKIIERLGSWPEALLAAGFIDERDCALRLARVTTAYTHGELLDVFAVALAVIGPNAQPRDFTAEREARQEANGGLADWPSWKTTYLRLGPWEEAVEKALAAHPEVLDAWDEHVHASLERKAA